MKRCLAPLLGLLLALSLAACEEKSIPRLPPSGESTWVVYWYLCGSDLESDYGCATADLNEMMEVSLPENVKVVIQTGGARKWQNDEVSARKLSRYLYDSNGLQLLETLPSKSMGAEETLRDFLSYGRENFPAEHTAVTFWNHGGGSLTGAAFDELFSYDSLTLDELARAFSAVFPADERNPPLDLIGFDTCLMASVDVAKVFAGIADYLVASEEAEPGNGWLYSGWLGALAQNPDLDALSLAKIICDTYLQGCEEEGSADEATLSVVDLSKVDALLASFELYGAEALHETIKDPSFLTQFSKVARKTENYGGNSREQGYTNMMDVGHLLRGTRELLQGSAQNLLLALKDCVPYRISGPFRAESSGLSCYFPYDGDEENLANFSQVGAIAGLNYLYTYALSGELPAEAYDYLAKQLPNETIAPRELPKPFSLSSVSWENAPVTVNDEGVASMSLGPLAYDVLAGVYMSLYYFDYDADIMLCLGRDNEVISDWEAGTFSDNFRGFWGSIDDCLVYMDLSFEGEDYNLYAVPIFLNGEEYNLSVVYDFTAEAFSILGARRNLDESGAADKNLVQLRPGDVIEPIHYAASISGYDELAPVAVDKITVSEDTAFYGTDLGDGVFVMYFEMLDLQGNYADSAPITFTVEDDVIYTSVD